MRIPPAIVWRVRTVIIAVLIAKEKQKPPTSFAAAATPPAPMQRLPVCNSVGQAYRLPPYLIRARGLLILHLDLIHHLLHIRNRGR